MVIGDFVYAAEKGIETAIWVTAPTLLMGLMAGFVVSVFQAATQINDAALAFIPKIGAVVVALMLFGPFMLNKISTYTIWTFSLIPLITQ